MPIFDGFFNLIATIRFTDILDMAITAFIIYKVLQLLARTGSSRALRGILLIVLIMVLANRLKLNVVNFIFGKTFELGVIALLVIFQPEVRTLLERMGGLTNRLGRTTLGELEKVIDEVVNACEDLSASGTGALIVFERVNALDEQIRTGTIIDADVNAELLKNIFYPNTPLHDGAVIIRGGRITAASCMLPLTKQQSLSKELGMRHRAGIGMSEAGDALVVIVSEENGSISVADGGILKRRLNRETLAKMLLGELTQVNVEAEHKSGFRALFQNVFSKDGRNGKDQ